ncbi:MAG: GTP-binding protein [Alphaproteobacteria bacterium]|jgi:GTP-binding protein
MSDNDEQAAIDTAEAHAEALEFGRKLFESECHFIAGANDLKSLPASELPEIAFAGRSNVGKSSLINALTRQTSLARTSRTPGRTQQINFFRLGSDLTLVDLPGFGYAKVSKEKISDWTRLIHDYLKGRSTLRRLCLLIDSRHGLKPSDRTLMKELDGDAVVYQVILTKTDRIGVHELEKRLSEIAEELSRHPAAHPLIIPTSSRDDLGIAELRAELATLSVSHQFG